MKIGIDIDGVILDYERVLKTYGDLYDFIELKKDILYIDFSKEFIEKHQGGEEMESNTIYSIVNTMTQLTEVNGIKIFFATSSTYFTIVSRFSFVAVISRKTSSSAPS